MHERSVVRKLVEWSLDIVEAEDGRPVRIGVRLGALSHIQAPVLQQHFDQLTQGSPLEGVTLDVECTTAEEAPDAMDVTLLYVDVEDPACA